MLDFDSPEWIADSEVPYRLRSIYFYWRHKGLTAIILNRVLTLLSITFMAILIFSLVLCIDYSVIFILPLYNQTINIGEAFKYPSPVEPYHQVFLVFFSVLIIFWGIKLIESINLIRRMREIRSYMHWLDIQDDEIQNLSWHGILDKIVRNQGRTLNRENPLTHFDIINLIIYQENYMIALLDNGQLDLSLPSGCCSANKMYCMSRVVEWSLEMTLFRFIFSGPGGVIRKEFHSPYLSAEVVQSLIQGLKWKFRIFGVLFFLLSPFIYTWLFIYFIFKYGEQLKNDPGNSVGMRSWSTFARWKFRNYNELPHLLNDRLARAYQPTVSYIDCFRSHIIDAIARFLSFVLGSIFILLLIAGIYDDQFWLRVEIMGLNGLVWLGILVPLLAVIRKSIQSESFVFEPNKYLSQIVKCTQYCPQSWMADSHRGKLEHMLGGNHRPVFEEITTFFPHKVRLWLNEAFTILTIPVLFIFMLPPQSKSLIKCFRDYTTDKGLVYGCYQANFSQYSGPDPPEISTDGPKIELSITNFSMNYPEWKSSNPQVTKYLAQMNELHSQYQKEINDQKSEEKYEIIESMIYFSRQ